jgi:putative endonuclease
MYYVYILTNKDNRTLYIGVTNNIVRRIYEHKADLVKGFTQKYQVHKLIYCEETDDISVAIAREKQLKGWRRQKKADLIESVNPEWTEIPLL